ncbi:MAG: toprim domain-containing protein [Cyanobacteria bacterium SZAS LIN-3]|nr:toprim domain-containing protein [Cyanobacteria bacterium SZAS LIN-3]
MIPASDWKVSASSYFGAEFPDLKKKSGKVLVKCRFHKERTGSLSICFDTGRFHCFGCGESGDIVDFHGKAYGLNFQDAYEWLSGKKASDLQDRSSEQPARKETNLPTTDKARLLWEEGVAITRGDIADKYLRARGIELDRFPETLRFHPSLKYWEKDDNDKPICLGRFPAMLAKINNPDGALTAVHRTYLSKDGKKADVPKQKKVLGSIDYGAIRLCPAGSQLALAEGIETALSFHVLTGVAAWAAISAGNLQKAEIPAEVSEVYICVDLDANGTGEAAARKLAEKLTAEGKTAYLCKPPEPSGKDFNDTLRKLTNANNK